MKTVAPSNDVLDLLVLFSAYKGISDATGYVLLPPFPLFVSVLNFEAIAVTHHFPEGSTTCFQQMYPYLLLYVVFCFCFATVHGAYWTKIQNTT